MVTRARTPCAAQPALVLEHVMSQLMREDIPEHEAPQGVARPHDHAFRIHRGAGTTQMCSTVLRQRSPQTPRRACLVVQDDVARADESSQRESIARGGCRHQLDHPQPVIELVAEEPERRANIRRRCWVVTTSSGAARPYDREHRASGGADAARIASDATGHDRYPPTASARAISEASSVSSVRRSERRSCAPRVAPIVRTIARASVSGTPSAAMVVSHCTVCSAI